MSWKWECESEWRLGRGCRMVSYWVFFSNPGWIREPWGEKAGKYHFRKLRPEYLQRQSRWDSSDIKQKRRHMDAACLPASVGLNLNNPNDNENILRPCEHSCTVLCLHLQLSYTSFQGQTRRSASCTFATCAPCQGRGGSSSKGVCLCNGCSEISIVAAGGKKTQPAGERCTCGNVPYACQEGQHAQSKQKILDLSHTKMYAALPHSATTPAANQTELPGKHWVVIITHKQAQPSCQSWGHSACVIVTLTPPLLPSVYSLQQLRGHRSEADRTDVLSLLKANLTENTEEVVSALCDREFFFMITKSRLFFPFLFYKSWLPVISFTTSAAMDL